LEDFFQTDLFIFLDFLFLYFIDRISFDMTFLHIIKVDLIDFLKLLKLTILGL
jgi:hypothetical protein